MIYTEVFIAGTEPRESCDVHTPWGTRVRLEEFPADTLAAPITEDFEF